MASSKDPFAIAGRPKAEVLTVGTELLTGSVANTNATFLSRELTSLGFHVQAQMTCRDEPEAIQEALRLALRRSEVIFISGGLGPTPDDLTRESVAEFFQVPLVLSKVQYREILRHYRERGKRVPDMVKREAYFPANAKPVFNRFGIALGFVIEERDRVIIVVPGVPGELTRLFESCLKPLLKKRFASARPLASLMVKTIGLSEPSVMTRLSRSFFRLGKFQFGIYPEVGEVTLRIYAEMPGLIRRLKGRVREVLGTHTYSLSEEAVEEVIGRRLRAKRWTVSIAESCTGGRISKLLTRVPGASHYFTGAVVAYDDDMKVGSLGISPGLIEAKGAVSGEIAEAMAQGVRKRLGTTLGLAVTGIAGPTGGTDRKPVGLVYIAIASPHRSRVWKEFFLGDREQIQERATKKALEYLWRWVRA